MDETRLVHNYSHLLQGIHSYQQMPMNLKASSIVQYAGGGGGSIWANASSYPTTLNSLATQFTEPPDQFVVLTNIALTFVVKRRTTDVLRLILEMEAGGAMGGPPSPEGLTAFVEALVFFSFI